MIPIDLVAVFYKPEHLRPTWRVIDRLSDQLKVRRRVFVANQQAVFDKIRLGDGKNNPKIEAISHDNVGMEFGAYQAGLNRLKSDFDSEWVVIANDTFTAHKNFARATRDKFLSELAIRRPHPTIIGHVDAITRSYRLGESRSSRWVRSHIFALNRQALDSLDWRIYFPGLDNLVPGGIETDSFFADALDPVLRKHLEIWLFRTEPGPQWYDAQPLTRDNTQRMANKARSILYEKNLSARLDACGAEFIDLSDLQIGQKIFRKLDDQAFDLKNKLLKSLPR